MLTPALCVCSTLTRRVAPTASSPPSHVPHRLALLMHHKEHGRASNTGCLLAPALGARIHVAGIIEQERALGAALDAAGAGGAAVLWPGEGAVTVDELRAATPDATWRAGLLLVAVDATWSCARKMVKRLPAHIPRVALPPEAFTAGRSLLFPVRKYAGPCAERFCTYEAALALLDAMGGLAEGEREALTLNLKLKVDALLKHKNKRPVYGEETGETLAGAQEERAALLAAMLRGD
jgi:DTW domain-containing protein YfiP